MMTSKNEEDQKKERDNSPSFFSLISILALFTVYCLVLLGLGFAVERLISIEKGCFTILTAWGICFFSGFLSFVLTWLLQRKNCSFLLSIGTGMFVRSGFPLISVLALFSVMDKIILKQVLIAVIIYYLTILPCEVWLFLPKKTECK